MSLSRSFPPVESKVLSLEKKLVRQAKLFRGDLIADSYSAVGQLFFSLPSPDVSCLLNDTAASNLDCCQRALLTWQCVKNIRPRFFHKPYSIGFIVRAISGYFAKCLSYRASRFLRASWLPLYPGTDRGRMTARDQYRHTSAYGTTFSTMSTPLGATPRYAIGYLVGSLAQFL